MLTLSRYPYANCLLINFYLLITISAVWCKYSIPNVKFEAFKPKGLRISIPHENGIRQFAFHGRVNGILGEIEPGEISADVSEPTGNFWIYDDPKIELRVGDSISYWLYVQHNYYGYRKDNLTWEVKELTSKVPLQCQTSATTMNSQSTCQGSLIFQDSFDMLDENKWLIENYIPNSGPNYEFNYYTPECVTVDQSKLNIIPVSKQNENELRGELNLNPKCTSSKREDCYLKQHGAYYLPPTKSGKIQSKDSFKYGKIEVTAKLPCGDWIYPEISLIPKNPSVTPIKIYIAYSRGNAQLVGINHGTDIGGKMLFAGPSTSPREPKRSEFLTSKYFDEPVCNKEHTFALVWNPDEVLTYVDGEQFGKIDVRNKLSSFDLGDSEYYISLGVSVGGTNDFPNDYTSGQFKKPWRNRDVLQIKQFFQARNLWLQTWNNKTSALLVESIRVYAL